MNKVILIGRLTADPNVTYRSGEEPQAIGRYTLAVDRGYRKDGEQTADFIGCTVFGKAAEFAEKYLTKGIKIAVTGRIATGSYINKDGQKIYTTNVIVDTQEFVESKASAQNSTPAVKADENGFAAVPDNMEELPFS